MGLLSFLTGVGSLFASDSKNTTQNVSGSAEQAVTGATSSTGTSATNTSGNSTTNASTNQTANTNTQTSQNQNSTSTQNQQSNQTTTGNDTTKTTGTTQQNNSGQSQGTQNQQQQQVTQNLSGDVLAQLEAAIKSNLGGNTNAAATSMGNRLNQLNQMAAQPGFNVNEFIRGISDQARASQQSQLDSSINGMMSQLGGTTDSNSMAALLANRMQGDAAANLAGISANAALQGSQLATAQQESLTQQIGSVSSGLTQQITALLDAAKGAQQATTGQTNTQTGQTFTEQQLGQQTQNQQSQSQQQSNISTVGTDSTQQNQTSNSSQQQSTNQNSTSNTQQSQTENVKTQQQVDETGLTTTNSNQQTKSKEGKDLFSSLIDKIGKASAAA